MAGHRRIVFLIVTGSCELMIGCIGKALEKELHMDQDEMDDVR